jgi:NADPH-dependent glutamate synthase beta subunit-like oxidoreductase/Pyruvate/2-oxoacid:ferredoxin oxidoreductase delta subunit
MNDMRLTFRRFKDGDNQDVELRERIFVTDKSYKCPTYIHRTPPCQGSCPSGEDIRGWLNIARGIEKPPVGMTWQEYAFKRITEANPFPSVMGRVCPALCQDGCNRSEVEGYVGINAVEHHIGDFALEHGLPLHPAGAPTGKRVALVGGGIASLTCAYQLRRMGHACTIFEARAELGGMMRYGIPGYRVPRDVLDSEIRRVLDLGIEVRRGVKIGVHITMEQLQQEFGAVFVGLGAQAGSALDVPGSKEAPNSVSGIEFLEAFNEGRLKYGAQRVLVIGGGDTAMDVAAVARRIGFIPGAAGKDLPETVLGNRASQETVAAARQNAEVTIVYRRPVEKMPATKMEIEHCLLEGVQIMPSLVPLEVVVENGRATALRVQEADWSTGKMVLKDGTVRDIPCDLIVAAIGQFGDLTGLEAMDNGKNLISADSYYRWPKGKGIFVGGDVVKPNLLTTAVGHGSIAAQAIDHYLRGEDQPRQPKVNVHHFNMLEKLKESGHEPSAYDHVQRGGTDEAEYAVHNYEDLAKSQVVPAKDLFLGHFKYTERLTRSEKTIDASNVLGNFESRLMTLPEKQAQAEALRCMSCGMCFECDNCMIYCPQQAVTKLPKSERTLGRYVTTDYSKCIGCHICKDVCPTAYIQMGLER